MSCRINQLNKKTGVTYVYESLSYWDKEKKQPRNKKICVGRLDSKGVFVPSTRLAPAQAAVRDPIVTASAEILGSSIILDTITDQLGLEDMLKASFPKGYRQILTMAYYLVSQGGPLSHCGTWCKSHAHPFEVPLTSQCVSEILGSISMDGKQTFFNKWMKKVLEDDYLCYDITSISSYSEFNEFIKYGHNRDKEKLPQLNLAILFGQKGRLPVYYQRLPGNITDVTTLPGLLKTFKALEMKTFHYVLDKGFYSKKNVDELLTSRDKFVLSVPLNNKWVQRAIDDIHEVIHGPEGYRKLDEETLYVHTRLYPWGKENRRCYLHLYYNAYARAVAVDRFNAELVEEHQEAYDNFFLIKTTPKLGTQVIPRPSC